MSVRMTCRKPVPMRGHTAPTATSDSPLQSLPSVPSLELSMFTFDDEERAFLIAQIHNVIRNNRSLDATRREHGKAALYDDRIKWLQRLMTKVAGLPAPKGSRHD